MNNNRIEKLNEGAWLRTGIGKPGFFINERYGFEQCNKPIQRSRPRGMMKGRIGGRTVIIIRMQIRRRNI